MRKPGFTGRLAGWSARHPWWTISVWVVLLTGAVFLATGIGDVLTEDGESTVETESDTAARLMEEHFDQVAVAQEPGADNAFTEYVLVESETAVASDAAFQTVVGDLVADLRQIETVQSAVSYLDGAPGLVSESQTVALIPVEMAGDGESSEIAGPLVEAVVEADTTSGFTVSSIGNGSVWYEMNDLVEETLVKGERNGVLIALVVLLLVFGAAVAAGLPIVLAIAAIVMASGLTFLVGQAFELSFFVVNMITMIGLAVGIDYSLFIVQRFREERAHGHSVIHAVERTGDSATRAVFFSGVTVIIALLGLMYAPDTVMRSLGIGAILVVVAALGVTLTLLPALLGLLGDRVNKGRIPFVSGTVHHEGGGRFWHRVTEAVTARPILSVVLAGGLLLALAAPYLDLETGNNNVAALPEDSNARTGWETLSDNFDSGTVLTRVVIEGDVGDPAVQEASELLMAELDVDPAYGELEAAPSPDGELMVINAVTKLDPSTTEARDAVLALRETTIPPLFEGVDASVYVNGEAAWTLDYVELLDSRTVVIFAFVLGLSFLVLLTVFRSIVVPIKAIILNLLSVGAAYGLLVAVFQHGIGAELFGFIQTDVIESWIPLFLFTVLFGLSMDYHIFLLSRIKERYDLTGDNDESVAFGLGSTGAIITGAALIMVAVFGGFAMGDMVMFQQMGFGLAAAVIIDATIVRSVLVPASMKLLGERNWYFPRWLDWLPEIHIEGRPQVPVRDDMVPEPV